MALVFSIEYKMNKILTSGIPYISVITQNKYYLYCVFVFPDLSLAMLPPLLAFSLVNWGTFSVGFLLHRMFTGI